MKHAVSNYFHVDDPIRFGNWLDQFEPTLILETDRAGRFALRVDPSSDGWPVSRHGSEGHEVQIDFVEELARHLAPGETAVLQDVGVLTLHPFGTATAVHSDGRTVTIGLDDIFDLAERAFGARPDTEMW